MCAMRKARVSSQQPTALFDWMEKGNALTHAAQAAVGTASDYGLDKEGLRHLRTQYWNLTAPLLYEHAIRRHEGEIAAAGWFMARPGKFPGRPPKDKFIADDASSHDNIAWGDINKPVSEAV